MGSNKPDGTPRKLMDSHKMRNLGWNPNFDLKTGINHTYNWFLKHQISLKSEIIIKNYQNDS